MKDQSRDDVIPNSRDLPAQAGPGLATDAYKSISETAYLLSQQPVGTRRPLRIVCVGAGFSGLAFAREVKVGNLQNVSLTIYEKNAGIGGTWYENRYPGCACEPEMGSTLMGDADIPVHNYQLSWAPYPYFPSYYGTQKDIHDYQERVADQHDLRQFVKTSHKVVEARWIEETQKWQVQVVQTDGRELMTSNRVARDGEIGNPFVDECDILINASGCFNDWKWPNVPGREKFRGEMLHSAIWPKDLSLKDRTVALIGNGSTGVQILPAILDEVKKVYVYIRSKTWITAGFAQKFSGPGGTNLIFSEEQKKIWAEDPEAYLGYRKEVESELNGRFKLYLKHTEEQRQARSFSVQQMSEKLRTKPEIIEKLIPDFAVGCRRATPGNGYLEALCSEKVEIIWGGVEAFDETGLWSSAGSHQGVDTIICATGFNMSFSPRFPIFGRSGVNLQTKWDRNPECYLSVTSADMPNYFIYLGPGSPLGHGSVVTALERVTDYIVAFITKLQTQNYSSVVPRSHIPRAYQQHALKWLEKTAWNSDCVSTYKNGRSDGPLVSLHPGSRLHYFYLLANPRWEDFEWTSLCPDPDLTFAWMANGFTVDECHPGTDADLTWFLRSIPREQHIKRTPAGNDVDHEESIPKAASDVGADYGASSLRL